MNKIKKNNSISFKLVKPERKKSFKENGNFISFIILLVLLMSEQVYDFFEVIVREVIRNVTSL